MIFNSLTFAAFFACVLLLHRMPFGWTVKKLNLLIASYLFYAAWNPPFVIMLWCSGDGVNERAGGNLSSAALQHTELNLTER